MLPIPVAERDGGAGRAYAVAVTMQMQRLEEMLARAAASQRQRCSAHGPAANASSLMPKRILKMHDEAVSAFSEKGLHGSMVSAARRTI